MSILIACYCCDYDDGNECENCIISHSEGRAQTHQLSKQGNKYNFKYSPKYEFNYSCQHRDKCIQNPNLNQSTSTNVNTNLNLSASGNMCICMHVWVVGCIYIYIYLYMHITYIYAFVCVLVCSDERHAGVLFPPFVLGEFEPSGGVFISSFVLFN